MKTLEQEKEELLKMIEDNLGQDYFNYITDIVKSNCLEKTNENQIELNINNKGTFYAY